MRKRVRPGGGNFEALFLGEESQVAAQPDNLPARFLHVRANVRAQLDDGLVHLGLDVFLERHVTLLVFENLLDVGSQFARLGIDDLELLLDAEGEGVLFVAHGRKG